MSYEFNDDDFMINDDYDYSDPVYMDLDDDDDDSIQISETGYPRLINPTNDLDLIVLEVYEEELLKLLFENNAQFCEIFRSEILQQLPEIKKIQIRDDYISVVYQHEFPPGSTQIEGRKMELQDCILVITRNIFEKKDLKKLNLIRDDKFDDCFYEQLVLNEKNFIFGFINDKFHVSGLKDYMYTFFNDHERSIEYSMKHSINIIKAFKEYKDFKTRFLEAAAGSEVNHDLQMNAIKVKGLYVDCAYYCAFVQYFMKYKLNFINTFLSGEQMMVCDNYRWAIEKEFDKINVYLDSSSRTLWSTNPDIFDAAKQIITKITGIEFSNEELSVTENCNKIVMKYFIAWEIELRERFKGLEIKILDESSVSVKGVRDGVACFLSFLKRIIEKKVEFLDKEVDEESLKEDLCLIKNICYEISKDYIAFIGPDEDVDDACFVVDQHFEASIMEQSYRNQEITLTVKKCPVLYFLFRDNELYNEIRQQFSEDIAREIILSESGNEATFLINGIVTEFDLKCSVETRIKKLLCTGSYEFKYPASVKNDENNNVVNEFVNKMEESYANSIKEKLLQNIFDAVQIESITCKLGGTVRIDYIGTQQAVDNFGHYLDSEDIGEVVIGDRHLLKDIDNAVIKKWHKLEEPKVIHLETQPQRNSIRFTGPKAVVTFLQFYLGFLRDTLAIL